ALIRAAGWRGKVVLRARPGLSGPVLEVTDNGIGMTEEVRQRCTEAHYSTKRDNALHEGHSTGMGLGLSFVVAILATHEAKLEIVSKPMHGAAFRVLFRGASLDAQPGVQGSRGRGVEESKGQGPEERVN